MEMVEYSASNSLQADSNVKFAAWPPAARPHSYKWPEWTHAMALP